MNSKEYWGLMEAYAEVYAPEQLDEAITSEKGKAKAAEMIAKRTTASGRAKPGQGANVATIKHIGRSNRDGLLGTPPNRKVAGSNWPKSYSGIGGTGNKAARRAAALKNEELDIFDVVLEFLQAEGYAETLEEAEWLMANMIDEEAIGIILGEGREGRRFEYNQRHGRPLITPEISQRASSKETLGGGTYERGPQRLPKSKRKYDRQVLSGVRAASDQEKQRARKRMGISAEAYDYVNEAQAARENPEKYEREQEKKSAPVRGEKTPMPPRGDKRREDFEKWYAKQMGR